MASRSKGPAPREPAAPPPEAEPSVPMSVAEPSQVDRANALARAREAGYREGVISAFAECAAIVQRITGPGDFMLERMLAELRRRFPNDPRVHHHLEQKGIVQEKQEGP